jgi:hypothetical protein
LFFPLELSCSFDLNNSLGEAWHRDDYFLKSAGASQPQRALCPSRDVPAKTKTSILEGNKALAVHLVTK